MKLRKELKTRRRYEPRTAWLLYVTLLWVAFDAHDVSADPLRTDWKAETRLYLSGLMYFAEHDGQSRFWDTFAASAELRVSSDRRPYYAGVFADYRMSSHNRIIDNLNLGALFRYNWHWWDVTSYAFINRATGSTGQWFYAGRLRYRLADNHKIGIETVGKFSDAGSPQLQFGYYGSLSESISLNVVSDPGWNRGADLSGRVEVVWTIRRR